jgi:hypothetical protein
MCLYVNKQLTMIGLSSSKDIKTFWKLFVKHESYLETPYLKYKVNSPGLITVDNPIIWDSNIEIIGGGAFHLRTHEEALKRDEFHAEFFEMGKVVKIPVQVTFEDIIAFGGDENVAVRAYMISVQEWNKIFKKNSK